MYRIQNHRINLDQITHVALGEALKVRGAGIDIIVDGASLEGQELLEELNDRDWLSINGNIVNPKAIVAATSTPEGHLKVNLPGLEIWVPDEKEKAAILALAQPEAPQFEAA